MLLDRARPLRDLFVRNAPDPRAQYRENDRTVRSEQRDCHSALKVLGFDIPLPDLHCALGPWLALDVQVQDRDDLRKHEHEERADVEIVEQRGCVRLNQRLERQRCDEDGQRQHDLNVRILRQRAGQRDRELTEHHDRGLPRHYERAALGVVPSNHEAEALTRALQAVAPRRAVASLADAPTALLRRRGVRARTVIAARPRQGLLRRPRGGRSARAEVVHDDERKDDRRSDAVHEHADDCAPYEVEVAVPVVIALNREIGH